MKLEFPPLGGGVTQGLNDAGIETFEGDYAHYVVRECTQNSLDAAADHHTPVRVEIAAHLVTAAELPFLPDLRIALEKCESYWHDHERPRHFFHAAANMAARAELYLLRISDYGTTGVPGDDRDNTKPWFGLVRSRGVSIKSDEDSGGAFGIGKDAPLAASALRTVVYSTRTADGSVALQGVSRLATHEGASDQTQGTGFIGDRDSAGRTFIAIRDVEKIPPRFRRDEPGLDVWVIGFRYTGADWETPFVAAALRNFWPAIHFGRLTLRIGTVKIDQSTLPRLMQELGHEEAVEEAYPYYRAVTDPGTHAVHADLPVTGRCSLHVLIGGRDLPRKVCMTRKTGMLIYYYPPRTVRVPFAALFCCEDFRGNRLLKALEPPCHDEWLAKRAETSRQKDALKEIKEWIRTSLMQLIPDLGQDSFNEDSIADLLPDELPGSADDAAADTDLGGRPVDPRDLERLEPPSPSVRTGGTGAAARGDDPERGGAGEGDTTDPKKGDSKKTGGRMSRGGGEEPSGGGAAAPRKRIDLRSYRSREQDDTYHLVARVEEDHCGQIRIDAVTEDGAAISCPLAAAFDESGAALLVTDNCIHDLSLSAGEALRLSVVLRHPMRVALRASTL